ncbi:MAG: hypothetical protein ACRCVT_06900 [Leadbetterella sp.]
MGFAITRQNFQDWFTQQWVILWGKKIEPEKYQWLIGPFGNVGGIGKDFIYQLAELEGLDVKTDTNPKGLISSINQLDLSQTERARLSVKVVDFYERTNQYDFFFSVSWNPIFKFFGKLVNTLFSARINQLNIPLRNTGSTTLIKSEIISLFDPKTHSVKYTFWHRTDEVNNKVIYSGIYGICQLPNGKSCIRAIFPLPNGNATIILSPSVGSHGELILDSSGKKIGDSGFYFLLSDTKGRIWTQFLRTFRDRLIVSEDKTGLKAIQTLTLWNIKVLTFTYKIRHKA